MLRPCLLDTSFFIALLDSTRPHHRVAVDYLQHFVESGRPLFLSTIVLAEYCLHGALEDLPLQWLAVLPFNYDHALKAAAFPAPPLRLKAEDRAALHDDLKLIAQATVEDCEYLLTDDSGVLFKHATQLQRERHSSVQPLRLADGFDLAKLLDRHPEFDFSTPEANPPLP